MNVELVELNACFQIRLIPETAADASVLARVGMLTKEGYVYVGADKLATCYIDLVKKRNTTLIPSYVRK